MISKSVSFLLGTISLLLFAFHTSATVYYVNATNPAPSAPFTTWATAATNIQDAINLTSSGDTVLVTNGLYAFGGQVMDGVWSNRVALTRPITVQSVNGPWVTTIQGGNLTNGAPRTRCAWLTNNAVLVGFTLEGGSAISFAGVETGGGVWCASSNAIVANCVICSNYTAYEGGGVYLGTLRNCAIFGNNAEYGGGTYNSYLINCTVTANFASLQYGGSDLGFFTNSIIYNNTAGNINNSAPGQVSYCCTYPLPSGGIGNFTNLPLVFADNVHLFTNSPCIGAGINLGYSTDIDGRPWANPPSIGCSEAPTLPVVSQPVVQLTNNPVGFTVSAAFTGLGPLNYWWLKDGALLPGNGQFSSTQTTSLMVAGTLLSDAGGYQLVVSNAFGIVTSAVVQVTIHCVDANGTNPVPPYLTWATAATNIQDAITAAAVGEIVLVTNGLYATGGISMDGVITNRVSVNKAVLVQSVNGPNAAIIQGAWDPVSTNGPGAIRCAWLTTNAIMSGFTLRGGATRPYSTGGQAINGGGAWGPLQLTTPLATVANCVIVSNAAGGSGAGAAQLTLNSCVIATNIALGNGSQGGSGGGASACSLNNCFIVANVAIGSSFSSGGGVSSCSSKNCAIIGNSASVYGGGASGGSLTNCTVTVNQISGGPNGYGGGVANSTLVNCIVYFNSDNTLGNSSYSNSYNSTFNYCCTAPAATGTGNISSNPQLLADRIHLSSTSLCIGAGSAGSVSGTDIDGQSWNNPPSIGCDEWQPVPVITGPLVLQAGFPAHGLTCSVIAAGQPPFVCYWSLNGSPIQDDGHHSNSSTTSLAINQLDPSDAGLYQVVVSNSFGVVTSHVAQVVIHAVNIAGVSPVVPYSTWATAATNIQDAINAASAGDIVLVTNGLYATGGLVMVGDLTNRVALNKPVTVMSVNGYQSTVIQGAWDLSTTNGPGAVRCAYVGDGALLNGFTLQNGATRSSGDAFSGGPLESGGGVYCATTNGVISNCMLSNNSAVYGGGMAYGTLNNSLVHDNQANYGGGAYFGALNNCTVENNSVVFNGGGTYSSIVRNSIVLGNNHGPFSFPVVDNYYPSSLPQYSYSCSSPTPSGTGNINANPVFLDYFHISSLSPCRGAGSALYSSGTDLDGEPWNLPPSMGCDEVVISNLTGPLVVNINAFATNLLVNRPDSLWGQFSGRVSYLAWSFGDGQAVTNAGGTVVHQWTNPGDYTVTFTAYNIDNPLGVSTNVLVHVQPLAIPQLQSTVLLTNGFQFQFTGQTNATYTIQYATNLAPPVSWQTLQTIFYNNQSTVQVTDASVTNSSRFYRVSVQ